MSEWVPATKYYCPTCMDDKVIISKIKDKWIVMCDTCIHCGIGDTLEEAFLNYKAKEQQVQATGGI